MLKFSPHLGLADEVRQPRGAQAGVLLAVIALDGGRNRAGVAAGGRGCGSGVFGGCHSGAIITQSAGCHYRRRALIPGAVCAFRSTAGGHPAAGSYARPIH